MAPQNDRRDKELPSLGERQVEIIEQLARLEVRLDNQRAEQSHGQELLNDRLGNIDKSLEKLQHNLSGNGEDGLFIRIDRLEQSERRRSRLTWIAIAAAVAALLPALFELFKR